MVPFYISVKSKDINHNPITYKRGEGEGEEKEKEKEEGKAKR